MSASRETIRDVKAARDEYHVKLTAAGHKVAWKLGENAMRKGWAYTWCGTCENCGGNMSIGSTWTSTTSVVDLRNTECAGPGTHVLTGIEQARFSELLAPAVAAFAVAGRKAKYATAPLN